MAYVLKQDLGHVREELGACCASCVGGGPCVTSVKGLGEIGGFNSILLAGLGIGVIVFALRAVGKKAA